ncbi:hypothetical protein B0H19DRAFT_1237488 [Mycena capillaripes]|nr:hypothetical protein B0H19DRAFT_1237488 [Mycena capillaripes]
MRGEKRTRDQAVRMRPKSKDINHDEKSQQTMTRPRDPLWREIRRARAGCMWFRELNASQMPLTHVVFTCVGGPPVSSWVPKQNLSKPVRATCKGRRNPAFPMRPPFPEELRVGTENGSECIDACAGGTRHTTLVSGTTIDNEAGKQERILGISQERKTANQDSALPEIAGEPNKSAGTNEGTILVVIYDIWSNAGSRASSAACTSRAIKIKKDRPAQVKTGRKKRVVCGIFSERRAPKTAEGTKSAKDGAFIQRNGSPLQKRAQNILRPPIGKCHARLARISGQRGVFPSHVKEPYTSKAAHGQDMVVVEMARFGAEGPGREIALAYIEVDFFSCVLFHLSAFDAHLSPSYPGRRCWHSSGGLYGSGCIGSPKAMRIMKRIFASMGGSAAVRATRNSGWLVAVRGKPKAWSDYRQGARRGFAEMVSKVGRPKEREPGMTRRYELDAIKAVPVLLAPLPLHRKILFGRSTQGLRTKDLGYILDWIHDLPAVAGRSCSFCGRHIVPRFRKTIQPFSILRNYACKESRTSLRAGPQYKIEFIGFSRHGDMI